MKPIRFWTRVAFGFTVVVAIRLAIAGYIVWASWDGWPRTGIEKTCRWRN